MRTKPIDEAVLIELSRRTWPGNVRELRNMVERMAILSGERISLRDVPDAGSLAAPPSDVAGHNSSGTIGERPTLREHRVQAETAYISSTLQEVSWNISKAATLLGVERTNLHKKMRAYGIRREES